MPKAAVQAQTQDAKPMAFTATPSLIDTALPIAPERYGKYHLLERIGVGGMAEVWRAKTMGSEGFTKDLVIKRILPKFTNDEDSVRMFIDEARLVAKLHHPNIVQIFDFDKEGDRYYLAMELIEGRDLRQAEKAAAKSGVWFPIPLSIYLISEALKGLHYAASRQDHGKVLEIVHRDISPHNILISFSGDVKISDFGIAKVAERASSVTSGTVKGKLAYMSPEQITGQPLDGRTDIYSMGIVFWELLTRHRLFFGPDEHDVIRRVRDGIVPPPRQYNPDIPEEVEKIVMKMLVANRAQRYQSAGEVARQLCALPQYAYEAQSLGEFMRSLFPEQTRNWTQMLQNMLSSPDPKNAKPSPGQAVPVQVLPPPLEATPGSPLAATPASEQPAPRSPMAGSDQKTQIATEVPPQVASALAAQQPAPPKAGASPPAAPNAASNARTVIATAPVIPATPPPPSLGPPPPAPPAAPPLPEGVANARTVIATAPVIPTAVPATPSGPHAGGTLTPALTNPGPGIARPPATAPLVLRPASTLFGAAAPSPGMLPTLKWVIGPIITVVVALLTTFAANRIWPPATGSGGGGPSFLAAKRVMQIVTIPPQAELRVDGIVQDEKTPTEIRGDIGTSARIRLTLPGHDPYEATIAFTKDPRPPLRVKLFKVGERQKLIENSGDEEHPNTAAEGEEGKAEKQEAKAEKDKTDKPGKAEKPSGKSDKKGEAAEGEEEETGRKRRKKDKAEKDKAEKDKAEGDSAKKGKATLTILVRPWAIVYLDGKKLQQTPLRNHPISAGSHKLLLVNDSKGKREEIKLKVTAGEQIPEIKRTWE